MSDQSQGEGWWMASDRKWYPPHLHPDYVAPPPPPPVQIARKTPRWVVAVAVLVGFVILGAAIGEAVGDDDGDEPSRRVTTTRREATSTTSRSLADPKPEEFTIGVVVTEKECFGSAGCIVTYDIDLNYLGPGLDPDGQWTLIYEVVGGEQQRIGSLTLRGDGQITYDGQESIDTVSEGDVLTARVTTVR